MTRCDRCDREKATRADLDHAGPYTARCETICFVDFSECDGDPVDWRARALNAEAEFARLLEVAVLQSRYAGTVVIDTVATVDGVEYRLLRAHNNSLLNVWTDGNMICTPPMLTLRLNDAAMKSRAARLENP